MGQQDLYLKARIIGYNNIQKRKLNESNNISLSFYIKARNLMSLLLYIWTRLKSEPMCVAIY